MTGTPTPFDKIDPAAETLMRAAIGGAVRTQAVYVAAKLGIADHLALGPQQVVELARRVHADADTLRRVLRFLVVNGVFTEAAHGAFALNGAAELLQTAHPRSLRPSAIRAGEGLWNVSSRLLDAVQTGNTPHADLHGSGFFDHVAEAGKERSFSSRMGSSTEGLGAAIAQLDCVRQARTIVDVGGSLGTVLTAVLREHAHLRGVLFDQASVIEIAREALGSHADGVRERVELVPGNFFDGVPPGGDVYLLSWILHDWADEDALRILRACRATAGPQAIVVIAEVMLPDRATPGEGPISGVLADPFTLDLQMLLLTGGRERTADEYRKLLAAAGYRVHAISGFPSRRAVSAIEAHPGMTGNQE